MVTSTCCAICSLPVAGFGTTTRNVSDFDDPIIDDCCIKSPLTVVKRTQPHEWSSQLSAINNKYNVKAEIYHYYTSNSTWHSTMVMSTTLVVPVITRTTLWINWHHMLFLYKFKVLILYLKNTITDRNNSWKTIAILQYIHSRIAYIVSFLRSLLGSKYK